MTELTGRLSLFGLSLYVTVMPATPDGEYYDGYDYRAIGAIADKVILMAHDYSVSSMAGFIGSTYYKTTAYRSPYVTYVTESGQNILLWYEDSRSISEKLALARLFGVSGVSAWRLGLIPDYTDAGLSYDVASVLT